jgi:hypothetical protein
MLCNFPYYRYSQTYGSDMFEPIAKCIGHCNRPASVKFKAPNDGPQIPWGGRCDEHKTVLADYIIQVSLTGDK